MGNALCRRHVIHYLRMKLKADENGCLVGGMKGGAEEWSSRSAELLCLCTTQRGESLITFDVLLVLGYDALCRFPGEKKPLGRVA